MTTEELQELIRTSSFFNRFNDPNFTQNWYAAFCNNEYKLRDGSLYSCSWRTSGRTVADIRKLHGFDEDYLHWYCSGITILENPKTKYVSEGEITPEIFKCLKEIGLKPNLKRYMGM